MASDNLELVEYSERSLAIFGDTKPYKEQLKALGGKFNGSLTLEGQKRAGWIFQKSKYDDLVTFMTEPEPDPQDNGLLASNGNLTSTGKQFLSSNGERVETLSNLKTPVRVLTKPTLSKVAPKPIAKPAMRTPEKRSVRKYNKIELDKATFKQVKKAEKHHICVSDPAHYESLLPGDKISFFDGVDTSVSRTVISVFKVANVENLPEKYDDTIVLDRIDDDVAYEVIIEF